MKLIFKLRPQEARKKKTSPKPKGNHEEQKHKERKEWKQRPTEGAKVNSAIVSPQSNSISSSKIGENGVHKLLEMET